MKKIKELQNLDSVELKEKLKNLKEELFNLRFQSATSKLDNPKRIKEVKKDIARCYTILKKREVQV